MGTPRITPQQLSEAASVASEHGVQIVIECAGKVYKIGPAGSSFPVTASEKDDAACDEAFGVSG